MPANVEIKAKIEDCAAFKKIAKEISGDEGTILQQVDTFFFCKNGRLKLRCINGRANGQLIHYQRPDKEGPKVSDYSIAVVEDPDSLVKTLSGAYGARGEVRKKRTLFLAGQTRIHVDEVQGLGDFMELEVVLKDQTEEEGQRIAEDLMQKLGVKPSDLLDCAYIDMILKEENKEN